MIQIHKMTEVDAKAAAVIEEVCFSIPWSEQSLRETILQKNSIFLAAEFDGRVVGYCGLLTVLEEGDITNVAVLPEFRRKGIARLLLLELLAEARKVGIIDVTLEARESNAGAIALYESIGFVAEGMRKKFYQKPVENALILWKRNI